MGELATLATRARAGDRTAALQLVIQLAPSSITELVEAVFAGSVPEPWQFDTLSDAYEARIDLRLLRAA